MTLSLLLLLACKDQAADDSAEAWAPELYCPGSPDCASNDGALRAGAATVSIVPTCFEAFTDLDADAEWDDDEDYLDCGCDRLCPEDEGYPGADEGEGDGHFQAVWLAGFQNRRPATGVHDVISARAIVFDQGDTRVGIVTLDLVGFFNSDVLRVREGVEQAGLDVDHLVVLSSHTHEAPDTIGMWGPTDSTRGVDDAYIDYVVSQSVEAVRQAVGDLREVGEFRVGHVDASTYSEVGIRNVLRDARDPKIVDVTFSAALLRDTAGETIATLSHFGNHPESMADENTLITADYVDSLRTSLESGVHYESYDREGYGGVSLFLTGTVGGMMTPLGLTITDGDGVARRDYTFERTEALGKVKAEMAMDAIEGGELVDAPALSVERVSFLLPVENWAFQAGFLSGILQRETLDWDPSQVISETNLPKIATEMNHLAIGPLEMLTIPGELLPELAVGGYDGSKVGTTLDLIIGEDNPNPPDLSLAPAGPYIKDYLHTEHAWILGLANDELGYMVPPYNFELDDANPWFDEAEGDHYEETNSLGPSVAPMIDAEALRLMDWVNAR